MKRIQLEPWTAFDKHCLTSAVSRVGDQNWTAVSRATRNIYEDSIKWLPGGERRSVEWFSNKQCAAQYEHLLKSVPPRRKKRNERVMEPGNALESPAEVLQQSCRHEFVEELKRTLAEEQAQYLKLLKEYEDILAGRLDHKLEEMQEEYEAKEREKEIKLKLKYKLGEKNLAEAPSSADHDRHPPPPDLMSSPIKMEKELGLEQPKTSVTTSPLLTSLLQSPSPLTRPSSATPTISLLLNSSPSIPSHESPTLSKLLEGSCSSGSSLMNTTPTLPMSGVSGAMSSPVSSAPPALSYPQATTSLNLSLASTSTSHLPTTQPIYASPTLTIPKVVQDLPAPEVSSVAADHRLKNDGKPLEELKPKLPAESGFREPETSSTTNAILLKVDEKRRGVPRKLDLENISKSEPEEKNTASQVIQTIEEIIDKVQFAVTESMTVETHEGPDLSSTNAESEATTVEEHSLDTLELSSDAVELIVMGPDRPPCIEVNRDTDSSKDDESKEDNIEEIPDIDEIQPSISASDVAQLENVSSPSKDPTTEVELCQPETKPLDKDVVSPGVTIEQAEADLAALTQEEDDAACKINESLPATKETSIIEAVAEGFFGNDKDKEKQDEGKHDSDTKKEVTQEVVEEKFVETVSDKTEEEPKETETKDVEEIATASDKEVIEPKENQLQSDEMEKHEAEEEDKPEPKLKSPETVQTEEVPPVATVNENSDSKEDDPKINTVTEDAVEDVKTPLESEKEDKIDNTLPEQVEEKLTQEPPVEQQQKEDDIEKPASIETQAKVTEPERKDVAEAAKEETDKVEELKPNKRESLRRSGKTTPPVTSSLTVPATSALSTDKPQREKRPVTPFSSTETKDKEVKEEAPPRISKRKRTANVSESSVPCSPSPSTVSNDDDKEYRAWKKAILLVYDRFAAHKYASVFLKPINESDAPGYFQIIKCPTDLTTIKRQIENGVIRNTVDFQKEMILMISNAIIYNKMDTLVHKMAYEMLPDMKEAMETMVQALGSGVPLDQPDSRPVVTARVSRASVSSKSQAPDDSASQPSSNIAPLVKRKRSHAASPEEMRSKKKRSDAV